MSAQVALAQQYTVTGTITDKTSGQPLIGANVFNKASGNGTVTNKNGKFTLQLPNGPTTLRISFIGYVSQSVKVSPSNNNITVELALKTTNLNQLVVTGLASSIKRSNVASDVTKVTAKQLTGGAAPVSVGVALAGKVPGVKLNSWSGAPGGGINFEIRGISTLGAGSSQPLIILDGVYLNNGISETGRGSVTGSVSSEDNAANRLSDLDPDDIASIQILKGPAAAAIYGQRANAGVVIIKTKSGQAGEDHVSINQSIGFDEAARFLGRAKWNKKRIIAQWDNPKKPGLTKRTQVELNRYKTAKKMV